MPPEGADALKPARSWRLPAGPATRRAADALELHWTGDDAPVQWLGPRLRVAWVPGADAPAALAEAFPRAARALHEFFARVQVRYAALEAALLASPAYPYAGLGEQLMGTLAGRGAKALARPFRAEAGRDLWGDLAAFPQLCAMLAWTATGGRATARPPSYAWLVARLAHAMLQAQRVLVDTAGAAAAPHALHPSPPAVLCAAAKRAGASCHVMAPEARLQGRWGRATALALTPTDGGAASTLQGRHFAVDGGVGAGARDGRGRCAVGWVLRLAPGFLPAPLAGRAYLFAEGASQLPWEDAGPARAPMRLRRIGADDLWVEPAQWADRAFASTAAGATDAAHVGGSRAALGQNAESLAQTEGRLGEVFFALAAGVRTREVAWGQRQVLPPTDARQCRLGLGTTPPKLPWRNATYVGTARLGSLGAAGALWTAYGLARRLTGRA